MYTTFLPRALSAAGKPRIALSVCIEDIKMHVTKWTKKSVLLGSGR